MAQVDDSFNNRVEDHDDSLERASESIKQAAIAPGEKDAAGGESFMKDILQRLHKLEESNLE